MSATLLLCRGAMAADAVDNRYARRLTGPHFRSHSDRRPVCKPQPCSQRLTVAERPVRRLSCLRDRQGSRSSGKSRSIRLLKYTGRIRCYFERLVMPNILLPGRMVWQFGHYNGILVDLNCGWYCLKAAIRIKHGLPGAAPAPHLAHPGLGTIAYDPANSGLVTPVAAPGSTLAWFNMLAAHGPVIVSGMLGGADWGKIAGYRLGVGHYILINGADTALDVPDGGRLFYYDPLQGIFQKHGTFNHMSQRINPVVEYVT
jgi:hypothetical protein